MKLHTCRICRHRQFEFSYTPKYCRACGAGGIKTNAYIIPLAAVLLALTLMIIFSLTNPFK